MSQCEYSAKINSIQTIVCDHTFIANEDGDKIGFNDYDLDFNFNQFDYIITQDAPSCRLISKEGYSTSISTIKFSAKIECSSVDLSEVQHLICMPPLPPFNLELWPKKPKSPNRLLLNGKVSNFSSILIESAPVNTLSLVLSFPEFFRDSDIIVIDEGGPNQEFNKIKSTNPFTLENPTKYPHEFSTPVRALSGLTIQPPDSLIEITYKKREESSLLREYDNYKSLDALFLPLTSIGEKGVSVQVGSQAEKYYSTSDSGIIKIQTNPEDFDELDQLKVTVKGDVLEYGSEALNSLNIFSELEILEAEANQGSNNPESETINLFFSNSSIVAARISSMPSLSKTEYMLAYSSLLTSENLDLSLWQPEAIKSMSGMFYENELLESIDLNHINTAELTNVASMFSDCIKLKQCNIDQWNARKIENMDRFFDGCEDIEVIDLSSWVIDELKTIESAFALCRSVEILDLSGFNTNKVTSLNSLFSQTNSITELNIKNLDFSNVISARTMFKNSNIKSIEINLKKIQDCHGMFESVGRLEHLDLNNWNTENLENITDMFKDCFLLKTLLVNNWNTARIEYSVRTFSQCISINSFDFLNSWNFDSLVNASFMFVGSNIKSLSFMNDRNFKSLEYCTSMFFETELGNIEIQNLQAEKIIELSGMFDSAGLENVEIRFLNKILPIRMNNLFRNNPLLESVKINNINTSRTSGMKSMFSFCPILKNISIFSESDNVWDTSSVILLSNMFQGCLSLTDDDIDFQNWCVSHIPSKPLFFDWDAGFTKTPKWGEPC